MLGGVCRWMLIGSVFVLGISGCLSGASDIDPGEIYRPPTAQNAPSPASTSTPPQIDNLPDPTPSPNPTATPRCTDDLTFIEDLSIPDGTLVFTGDRLDKRWSVENSGNCNWNASYRIKLVAGTNLGVPEEQALYPARSSSEATIRMVLIAPEQPGTFRSAWQAYSPEGDAFGDQFFIEIVVSQPGEGQ